MYVNKILENTHKPVTHPHRSFVPCITIAINNNFYKKIKKNMKQTNQFLRRKTANSMI